jgi:hypothetical protein
MAKSKRRATCFPDFTYGNIIGIKLWRISGTSQSALSNIVAAGGTVSFCKSVSINIEVVTEPCVQSTKFEMWGPNNYERFHEEVEAPFALYGDDGTVLKPKTLSSVGKYDLWISPDYNLYGYDKEKYFSVVVNNC